MRWLLLLLVWPAMADVQVLGDSVMWWNGGQAIPDVIRAELGVRVTNESVPGAEFVHPAPHRAGRFDIRQQHRPGAWDWIVLDGGANDLASQCDCARCDAVMDGLVSADGRRGAMPDFVRARQAEGARVLILGYYEVPAASPFAICLDELEVLEARQRAMARALGAVFVTARAVTDPAAPGDWAPDLIHPSVAASERIGRLIASAIASSP